MGDCTITIHAIGAHHNKKNPTDINKMAVKFVDELRAAGHNVVSATLCQGGYENLAELDSSAVTRHGAYDE